MGACWSHSPKVPESKRSAKRCLCCSAAVNASQCVTGSKDPKQTQRRALKSRAHHASCRAEVATAKSVQALMWCQSLLLTVAWGSFPDALAGSFRRRSGVSELLSDLFVSDHLHISLMSTPTNALLRQASLPLYLLGLKTLGGRLLSIPPVETHTARKASVSVSRLHSLPRCS